MMADYNEEYDAYVIEFDDVVICWQDEPDDNCEQIAADVRDAYNRNIRTIAEAIFDELKDVYELKDVDEVISKLGKPMIDPDNGQVTYCEHTFDESHIISLEYLDDEFNEIQYVALDG